MSDLIRGDLNQVLTFISLQLDCDPAELIAYAGEDQLGGYHFDPTQARFPIGSLFGVEGQILYALVRHLKPDMVVEIGGWAGASASHLALAVMRNEKGKVISVDLGDENVNAATGQAHGSLIAPNLKPYVQLVKEDGRVWLNNQKPGSIDIIFEDADHSPDLVMELSRLALTRLKTGGYLVNHDAGHVEAIYPNGNRTPSPVGQNVQDGLARAGAAFKAYLASPSDCGLALTVKDNLGVAPVYSPEAQPATPGFNFPQQDPYAAQFENLVPKSAEEFLKKRDFVTGKTVQNQWDIKEYQGNSNIESASSPPPVLQAQEKQTPNKKPAIKKPTAKKKPATKKTTPKT
jgi:predicted O-methyltransferase YrrM